MRAVTPGIRDKALFQKRTITARISTLGLIYQKQSSVILQNAVASNYCSTEIKSWVLIKFAFLDTLQVIFMKLSEVTESERKVSWGQQFWPIRKSFTFREFSQDYPTRCPPPALGSAWSTASHNHQTSDYLASVWCKELSDGGEIWLTLCLGKDWRSIWELCEWNWMNLSEVCEGTYNGNILEKLNAPMSTVHWNVWKRTRDLIASSEIHVLRFCQWCPALDFYSYTKCLFQVDRKLSFRNNLLMNWYTGCMSDNLCPHQAVLLQTLSFSKSITQTNICSDQEWQFLTPEPYISVTKNNKASTSLQVRDAKWSH